MSQCGWVPGSLGEMVRFNLGIEPAAMGSDPMRNAISHVRHFAVIGLVMGFVSPALAAEPQSIDWSKIPTQSITLFYPGLSTYDWLLSPAHPGATLGNQGQACLTCHKG